ncbi:hypothetical protein B0H11DRAFT_257856 [Mycena galericulata]|nr:hypothetical protein B0H11DRAFT_257856 [Mycena galericulata]
MVHRCRGRVLLSAISVSQYLYWISSFSLTSAYPRFVGGDVGRPKRRASRRRVRSRSLRFSSPDLFLVDFSLTSRSSLD